MHIVYTKASNSICKLYTAQNKHLQKGDKFTVHSLESLDLNISSEGEVTTVSGNEFQILIIRTVKKLDLKLWRGVDTGLSLMELQVDVEKGRCIKINNVFHNLKTHKGI